MRPLKFGRLALRVLDVVTLTWVLLAAYRASRRDLLDDPDVAVLIVAAVFSGLMVGMEITWQMHKRKMLKDS